jgi:hypothetical protein
VNSQGMWKTHTLNMQQKRCPRLLFESTVWLKKARYLY